MFPSPFCDGILRKTRNHQAERLGLCERRSLHALRVMCFAHKAQTQNCFHLAVLATKNRQRQGV